MKSIKIIRVRFLWSQNAKLNWRRSLLLIPLTIPLLTACKNVLPKAVEKVEFQPQAHHVEGKASVYVRGVETQGNLIVLDLLAINAHDKQIELSNEYDPVLLVDDRGNQYTAAEREISLQPHTSNNFKIAFAGSGNKNGDLTLKINSDNDYILTPQMTVDGIPLKRGNRIEFATYQPRQVKLSDTVFHHPNGLTFTIKDIKFYEQKAEVAFNAVNGSRNEVDLAKYGQELPFLEDAQGNKYSFVPLNSGKFSIPPRQTARGILHFAGQIPKSVSQLSLVFNDRGSDDDRTIKPRVVFTNLPGPAAEQATAIEGNQGEALTVSTSTTPSLSSPQNLNLQVNHANGSVMRLNRIAVTEDYIETDLAITNGYRNAIKLNSSSNRAMLLRDNLGNTYNLAPPVQNPDVKINPGETLKGTFRFLGSIAPNAQLLTLVTNDGYQNNTNTSRPYLAIADIPVTDREQEQNNPNQLVDNGVNLPANQTLDLQVNHANGSVMRLNTISFQEDNMVVDLAITNGYKDSIRLNNHRDFLLRDNLGNIYNLATIPQNPEVKILPGQTLTGKFVFLGRISPQANSLTLATNDKYGLDADYATRPKMVISAIPVESNQESEPTAVQPDTSETIELPETATNKTNSLPPNQTIEEQVNHANGSVLQLKTISFKDDSIVADLRVTNGYENEIVLNQIRDFLLRDNLGNVYHLATLPQNPEVKIPQGQTLTGKFVFLGRISPQANSLTLVTNDKHGSDRDYARYPKMVIHNISIK